MAASRRASARHCAEDTVYGEDGQLLTASFMDYAVPRADSFPFFDFETRNVPSTTNAMGIKGAGEAGTIGAAPAALNAVTDALWRAYGIGHIEMPATPARIWSAIQCGGKQLISTHHPASNPLVGIGLKVASVAIFVGMSTCIKAAGDIPAGQIVFFRSFFAIFPIVAYSWRFRGNCARHSTRSIRSAISRAASSASPPWGSASLP